MRMELATETVPRAPALGEPYLPATARHWTLRLPRLDAFELAVLIAFALVSCWTVALDLYYAASSGLHWTGTDGSFITDQMQYLGWIRSAAQHFLISDLFVLHSTAADYLQPAIVVSAGLTLLGVPAWLALLLWKPVAVVAIVLAARAFARRSLSGRFPARAALALALFYGSFTVIFGQVGVIGDLFPGFLSWGYPFALLALAAMVYALVGYDRARARGQLTPLPGLLAALAGLLHPWNDETFVVVVLGAELLALGRARPSRRQLELALMTLALASASLVYFLALGKLDPVWAMARLGSRHSWPFWPTVLVVAPLLPLSALGARGPLAGFWLNAVRVWPLACVAIFFFSESGQSATPLHAFQGITFPLAVLAVRGARRIRWGPVPARARHVLAALALAAACIPASAYELYQEPQYMRPTAGNGNYITAGERRALAYLRADRTPGGVVSRPYLGLLVPGFTGRRSYDGSCLWSEPDCDARGALTASLLSGQMSAARARRFLSSIRARFLLADCATKPDLPRLLGSLIASSRHFGCAAVYQLRYA